MFQMWRSPWKTWIVFAVIAEMQLQQMPIRHAVKFGLVERFDVALGWIRYLPRDDAASENFYENMMIL